MIKQYVTGRIVMSSDEYESTMRKMVPSSVGGQFTRIGPPIIRNEGGKQTVSFEYTQNPASETPENVGISIQWKTAADRNKISVPVEHLQTLLNGIENNCTERENADGTPTEFFRSLDYLKFLLRNGGQS